MVEEELVAVDTVDALVDDLHDFVRQPKYGEMKVSQVVAALNLVKHQLLEQWNYTR